MTALTDLQQLIDMLQRNGVVEYKTPELSLVLRPMTREAAAAEEQARQMPRMSEDLAAALRRIDPLYSDESLFSFEEHQ